MKEIKSSDSRQKAGYTSPSVRIIDISMRGGIMQTSVPPTDMDPTRPVF